MSKSVLKFVKPNPEHVAFVAEHMRGADRTEIWLSSRHLPLPALKASVARSTVDCYAVLADDVPLAIFGVGSASAISVQGSPWLLGSTSFMFHRRELALASRPMVNYLRGGYTLLENWVHADNIVSVRWLRSCGFTIEPAAPFGPFGAPFHRFWMPGELSSCVSQS